MAKVKNFGRYFDSGGDFLKVKILCADGLY